MPPSPTTRSVFASELVLALRQVREHAAPHMLGLIIACLRQPPGQRQNERHHVFGNGVDIDALRAGEADAALLEHCTVELIGAGTDRLNEAQLRRARRQLVAPKAGDHQHVGFADPGIELVVRGDAEVPDRQLAQCEALLQLIGDMREADGEIALGREHRWLQRR